MKKYIIIFALSISSLLAFNFSQDYFEVSKNLDVFNTLYRELNIAYVDETKPGQLMKTGIEAMLASLDPYTNYYAENDIEDYKYMTTGEYGGIGALIQDVNNKITITEPYEKFAEMIRAADPDGLHNLASNPKFKPEMQRLRSLLRAHLQVVKDPEATAYAAEFPA